MLSEQDSARSQARPLKAALVDVFVMNTFSYAAAAPLELIIAGMSWQAHLQVRLVALVLNSVIGRPYGLWRDFVFQRFGVGAESGLWRNYLADTAVFLSFQLPLYVINMVLGGADAAGIMKAAATAALLSGFLGRPYGLYLDFVRQLVGLAPSATAVLTKPETQAS